MLHSQDNYFEPPGLPLSYR